MTSRAPAGWPTVIPRIFVDDPKDLVGFIKTTFKAKGRFSASHPTQLTINDSMLMISGSEFRGVITACLYIYVDNTDAVYKRALKAGARSLEEPQRMPYGDYRAMIEDAWGNIWQIATPQ